MCHQAAVLADAKATLSHAPGYVSAGLAAELYLLVLQRKLRADRVKAGPPRVRQCTECDGQVLDKAAGRDRRTCSERCRKRKQRRLAKQATGYAHGRSMARSLTEASTGTH